MNLLPLIGRTNRLLVQDFENYGKELDEIVMRAIEKKPANRFQTMQEMLDAVRLLDSAYTLQVLRNFEKQDQ